MSKNNGDSVFSGSSVKQGQLHGIVTETGEHTFFGRAAMLVQGTDELGHFQQVRFTSDVIDTICSPWPHWDAPA